MVRLVYAQTILSEKELNELKRRTGKNSTKSAVAAAVNHYLDCQHTHKESLEEKLERTLRSRRSEKENYI